MRDEQGHLALGEFRKPLEDLQLAASVKRSRWFVEDEQLGISEIGTGESHLLPFAPGKLNTTFEAAAEHLAALFHVSRETIYRKFLDRLWITQTEYRRAVDVWNAQRQEGGSGGNHYRTKIAYLGREYIELAFRQYYHNKIDDEQLADYLDTKSKNVGALEEYFMAGSQ